MNLLVKKKKNSLLIISSFLGLLIIVKGAMAEDLSFINTLPLTQSQSDPNTTLLTIPFLRMPEISTQNLYTGTVLLNSKTQQYQVVDYQELPNFTDNVRVDPGFPDNVDKGLRNYLTQLLTTNKFVGAAIRVDMGDKSWRGVGGNSRQNETNCCNKPRAYSHRFRIGSITKMFVGSVVFALIREGHLTLDDTLEKWFGSEDWYHQLGYDTNGYGAQVTIRHLLNHTSGIPNYTNLEEFSKRFACHSHSLLATYRPEDMLLSLATDEAKKMIQKPGESLAYSNTNYFILGLLIEKITQMSLAENINRHVLIPAGLFNTTFPDEPSMPEHFSHGYGTICDIADRLMCKGETLPGFYPAADMGKICASQMENGFFYKRDATFSDPSLSWAAGAIISSVDDLAKTVKLQVNGEIPLLPAALLNERLNEFWVSVGEPCQTESLDHHCLGLGLMKIGDYIGHGGLINGYASSAFYNPKKDITIVLSVNEHTSAIGLSKEFISVLESITQVPSSQRRVAKQQKYPALEPLFMNGFTLSY